MRFSKTFILACFWETKVSSRLKSFLDELPRKTIFLVKGNFL
jgi:hypothetical protein